MSLSFELFWSFRSPYSYIALPRVVALTRDFAVDVELRVVHPAAIRNPAYFQAMNPLSRPYFLLDSAREAAFHGLPFRRPKPDPIVQDQQTLVIAGHQPYVHRLGRLGIAASERGRGLAFCDEVSRVLWDARRHAAGPCAFAAPRPTACGPTTAADSNCPASSAATPASPRVPRPAS